MGQGRYVMDDRKPPIVERYSEFELRNMIRTIIVELAPDPGDEIEGNMRLVDDLGYHSLAQMELAFTLEDEFRLALIDEETARGIQTVYDVENHVVEELRTRGDIKDVES
jgi:acyl carrier protein